MRTTAVTTVLATALLLASCGGGSSNSPAPSPAPAPPPPPPPPPPPALDAQYRASAPTPFAAGCDGVAAVGTLYVNAEVEPSLVANPADGRNLIASWQQDRWGSGGARGVVVGVSRDGGTTWSQRALAFTRCGGGNPGNGGDYQRASNAWMSISTTGIAFVASLAFDGAVLQPGSRSAVLAARSTDGGATWGPTFVLIGDGADAFNDKVAITADAATPHFVYAVWDRLTTTNFGPTWFARSRDDGVSWETARPIFDPGVNNQTISNAIVVLPNGTLINLFINIIGSADGTSFTSSLAVIRSSDNGTSWSAPVKIADNLGIGTRDPQTGQRIRDSSLVPAITAGPGGVLYVLWQDARFSSGARDAIAVSKSVDGGLSWSAPARVNADASVAAFSPTGGVRADGVLGVTYYDFRPDTSDRNTLPTAHWLARSADAINWQETQVAGPFDLDIAPLSTTSAAGLFLGDYQGLVSVGATFIPMFVQTSAGDLNNRTDVFAAPAISASGAAALAKSLHATPATAMQPSALPATWRRAVSDNIAFGMRARLRGSPQDNLEPPPE
ncbi:MAG: sialidase family protein [Rudaea sp.]